MVNREELITLSSTLTINSEKEQVISLVRFACKNIVESLLSNFISILIHQEEKFISNLESTDAITDESNTNTFLKSNQISNENNIQSFHSHMDPISNSNISPVVESIPIPISPSDNMMDSIPRITDAMGVTETDGLIDGVTDPASLYSNQIIYKYSIDLNSIQYSDFPFLLYSWNQVDLEHSILIKYIQTWSDKFGGQGTGVEADNIEDGVKLSFNINENIALIIRVIPTNQIHTIHMNNLSDHPSSLSVAVSFESSSNLRLQSKDLHNNNLDRIVLKASQNLLKSLLKELQVLKVSATSTSSNSQYNINTNYQSSAVSVSPMRDSDRGTNSLL